MHKNHFILILICFAFFGKAQQKNDYIYKCEFGPEDATWKTYDQETVKSYTKDGNFVIEHKSPEESWRQTEEIVINPNEDFEIETSVKQISGVDNYGYGITWGYKSIENAYYFSISSTGYFIIHMYKDNVYKELVPWKESKAILKLGNYNKLAIKKTKNELHFFINGVDVHEMEFPPFFDQFVGFYQNKKMTVEYDYLHVSQKRKPINLIENYNSFGEKEHLGDAINSPYTEKMPIISADEKTLYVARSGHPENIINIEDDDIWVATMNKDSTWGKLKNIGPPVNNKFNNYVISVSQDNNTLLLGNQYIDGGKSMKKGYSMSHRTKSGWSVPHPINIKNYYNKSDYNEACLAPDGKAILLTAFRDDSKGGKDIYVSFLQSDSSWTEPKTIGDVVNTFADETSPYLASDNKTLYFSTAGHPGYGKNDIFITHRLDDTWKHWSEPKNLGPKINTTGWDAYYTVPASGHSAYLVSTHKQSGNLDIFKIKQPQSARHAAVSLVHGFVYNSETKQPMSARISYTELGSEKELGYAISNPENGAYMLILPKGKKYSIHAVKENFIAVNNNTDVSTITEFKDQEIDQYLTPYKEGQVVVMNNLFFESNKFILLPESYPEIDRLYNMMKENPALKIELAGHTSKNSESDKFNMDLSTNRAQAVKAYLLGKGIAGTRMTTVGYGCTKPKYTQKDEAHQSKNRRVEFTILSK